MTDQPNPVELKKEISGHPTDHSRKATPFELRKEGDRVALYFLAEYQFRMTPENVGQLKDAIQNWENADV